MTKWDPADYLPTASPETKADLKRLLPRVRLYMMDKGVPPWLMAKLNNRVMVAWLAVRMHRVMPLQLPNDLIGTVEVIRIYTR
jgi:hypothetical protein